MSDKWNKPRLDVFLEHLPRKRVLSKLHFSQVQIMDVQQRSSKGWLKGLWYAITHKREPWAAGTYEDLSHLLGFKYSSVAEQDSVLQKVIICFIQLSTPLCLPLLQTVVTLYGLQHFFEGHQVLVYPGVPCSTGETLASAGSLLYLQNINTIK